MEFSDRYVVKIDNITELMNLNESEYLQSILGPKHLPMKLVLPITFVYVAIFVTGVFGNVVTCIVIRRNPVMQTATNYYLFNLAISDLLLLILGLPNELSVFWQQYPWTFGVGLCKIRAYVSETSSYVSVLTIVVFSLERYLAICHPLHLYSMSGLKRPVRFILGAWLLALIFALPFAAYTTVNYIEYPPSAVVITFFICWAPFHAQRLMYVYQVSAFNDINEWLYPLGGCLYYFSTTVNPILYNVMSAKYRLAFKRTLYCTPTSPMITRDDLSSMRDTTVCRCGSRRGSQLVRVRSVHYQRSIKCNVSHSSAMLRSPIRLRYDDEDDDVSHCDAERMPCDFLSPDTQPQDMRRSSFAASNGRTKYRSNEETRDGISPIVANETCI
ncbi:neuropeptides capa receptor-like isoform X2 [Temnothorax longispinosus]|uniref:neuropeptides capa receptor-like isoform X2 n=1 Tax=Temnothorax longispinosus TaxID=300112 RepID=UPI003A995C14